MNPPPNPPQFSLSLKETASREHATHVAGMDSFERVMLKLALVVICILAILFSFLLIILKPAILILVALSVFAVTYYRKMVRETRKS